MKVVWAPRAEKQVDEAMAYLERVGVDVAQAWLGRLLERAAALARFPDAGRRVPGLDRDDLREIIVGPYRVVYRRCTDIIEVLGVHHHARDFLRVVVEGLSDLEDGRELDEELLSAAGIEVGDAVDVTVSDGAIVVTPARRVRGAVDLEDLLAGIPEGYKHEELDWGPPVGGEVW